MAGKWTKMPIKITSIFQCKTLQKLTKIWYFMLSGNPATKGNFNSKKASGRRKPLSLFLIKPFIFSGPFNSLSTYFHFLSFQFASKKKEKGFLFGRRQGDRMSLPKKIAQNVARHSLC
jgi:hypothetical protein